MVKWLNILGLSFNIIGVVLLFRFGFPQPSFEEEVSLGIDENTVLADGTKVSDIMETARRKKQLYRRLSVAGLSLVLIGFVVQLYAVLLGR